MTEAEMQVVLDNNKADFKEKMDAMDANLKQSEKNFKDLEKKHRANDETSNKYYELQDKYDALSDEYKKLEHSNKGFERDNKTLLESNENLNSTNTKLIVDDGLSKELLGLERFSVRDGGMSVTLEALKKMNPTIVDGKPTFDGKDAKTFVTDWSNDTAQSGFYLQAKASGGGGANGGGGETPAQQPKENKAALEAQKQGDVAGVFSAYLAEAKG